MNMSTMPEIGSEIEARSKSIGAASWLTATRMMTTTTSFEMMRAITKPAHFPNHPRVCSQTVPEKASGARTTTTRIRDLRISRLNHTIAAAAIAMKARKIIRMIPAPGAVSEIAVRPIISATSLSPSVLIVSPAAWTIPMVS